MQGRAVSLVADAVLVGGTLLAMSAVAAASAIAMDATWWLVLVVASVGVVASLFKRRYTELNRDELDAASPLGAVVSDPLWRLPLRNLPVLVAALAFLVAAALLAPDALAVCAGFVAGQALNELRAAVGYRSWEKAHGKRLFGSVDRFRPIVRRAEFLELFVRPV